MKKLLLTSEWKFHQWYKSWLTKYRIKKEFVSLLEICMIFVAIMFCLVMFLIFINKSSTQWYSLRQARSIYNNVEFNYWIVKTKTVELKQNNRSRLKENNSFTTLWSNVKVIYVDEVL